VRLSIVASSKTDPWTQEEPRRYDKTYRRYATQVERALASFDSTREWPDYISFLSRLLKVISQHSRHYLEIY